MEVFPVPAHDERRDDNIAEAEFVLTIQTRGRCVVEVFIGIYDWDKDMRGVVSSKDFLAADP